MSMLLDLTLKVSLIVSVAIGGAWLLRRQSAAVRHAVLASAIAAAAALPMLALIVPAWNVDLASSVTVDTPAQASVAVAPASAMRADVPGAPVDVAAPLENGSGRPASALSASVPAAGTWMAIVWMAGVAAGVLTLLAGLARLRWLRRHATLLTHGPWVDVADEMARAFGLPRRPVLLQIDHPSLLATWGVSRPTVIVPEHAASWPLDRIRVVLAHELAHVRRRDWLVQTAADFLRAIYWFNPLLWIGCRRLRQESEQACDDAVLRMGVEGTTYAQHLVELARAAQSHRRAWLPAAAIARPSSLERRVNAMLDARLNRDPLNPSMAALAVVALLATALPMAGLNVFAQARFATVSGTVSDETGGLLTDVTLVLSNEGARSKHEVRTSEAGYFEFVGLPAGSYVLDASSTPGFAPLTSEVTVGVGESVQRNLTLSIGTVQETISVLRDARPSAQPAPPHARQAGAASPDDRRPRLGPCDNPAVGGCLAPPLKTKDVRPLYPSALGADGITGIVLLEATIGADGRTKDLVTVSSPHPELERAAIDAVGQWEFAPTLLNGRAVETRMTVSVTFDDPQAVRQAAP